MTKVRAKCQCGETDSEAFYVDRKRANGLHTYCKKCCKARARSRYEALTAEEKVERARKHRAWVADNRERVAGHKRRSAYGIDAEAFAILLARQGGTCAICRGPMVPVCVDHDHQTGAVRGLLCDGCNKAIGFIRDDPERLLAAAVYLKKDIFEATYEPVGDQ